MEQLPQWIYTSDFATSFMNDFPGDYFDEVPKEKIFEFPDTITTQNIWKILENIRYFGIDIDGIWYSIFLFMINPNLNLKFKNDLMTIFPEFTELWSNVKKESYDITKLAEKGLIYRIRYSLEQGMLLEENACHLASKEGHLKCLKYLHESGCPWNSKTTYFAIKHNHLDCFEYLLKNNCPFVKWGSFDAITHLSANIFEYLSSNNLLDLEEFDESEESYEYEIDDSDSN